MSALPAVVTAPSTNNTPAAPAPAEPAAAPASLADAFDLALGDAVLPEAAASPAAQVPAEPVAPTAPAAPAAPTAPVAPTAPAAPTTTTAPTPADPNDPFAALKTATGATEEPATPAAPTEELPQLDPAAPEKTKTAFATVTRKLAESEKRAKELETKIASSSTPDAKLPQLEVELKQEREKSAQMEKALEMVKLEATPKFQADIQKPINEITQTLAQLAQENQADANQLTTALMKPTLAERRAAVKEITKDWDPADALEARTQIESLRTLFERRAQLQQNAKQSYEEFTAQQRQQQEQQLEAFKTESKQAYESTWPKFLKAVPLLAYRENDPEWNASIDRIKETALQVESETLPHDRRAALTIQAVALPVILGVMKQVGDRVLAENKQLKEQVASMMAATPGAGSGTGGNGVEQIDPNVGFLDAVEMGMV